MAHHDQALDQALRRLLGRRPAAVVAHHVDARLLQVVDVHDVVDVAQQVEVGPAHRALVAMSHVAIVPDAERAWLSVRS